MAELIIRERRATVGRSPDSTLMVVDPAVSRTHAVLERREGTWFLAIAPDVTRQGIVTHNGRKVGSGESVPLTTADILRFGTSPPFTVHRAGRELVLRFPDETEPEREPDRERPVAAAPEALRAVLERSFQVVALARADATEIDLAVAESPASEGTAAVLGRLRRQRFFLTQALLGDALPAPDRAGIDVVGDAYVWLDRRAPELADHLGSAARRDRERERQALPHRTAEILHLDRMASLVLGHDWIRDAPRPLPLSELEHQILLVLADAHRQGRTVSGLSSADIAARLEARGWARSLRTVGNELSMRLPRAMEAAGLHPHLFVSVGTREKLYGLSTPASCLRDLGPSTPPRAGH